MKTATYETPVQRGEVENLIQSFNALDPQTGEVMKLNTHRILL